MSTIDQTTTDCPDWCQSKPHDDPDGGFDGPHTWPEVPAIWGLDKGSSALFSVDLAEPGTDEGALVYVDAPHLTMTPDQAHEAGLALLTVARWARLRRTDVDNERRPPQFKRGGRACCRGYAMK